MHILSRLIAGISVLFAVALPAVAQNEGDYGDAPETYANAFHSTIGQEWLGSAGVPSVTAETSPNRVDRDALDDGLASDGSVQVTIAPDAPAGVRYLNAWIDLNDDGTWTGADEHPVADFTVEQAPGTTASYSFPELGTNLGVHWIRVTLTRAPISGAASSGVVRSQFGETEDYPGGRRSGPATATYTPSPSPTPTATVYDPPPPSPEPTETPTPSATVADPGPPDDPAPPGNPEDEVRTPEEECADYVQFWKEYLTDLPENTRIFHLKVGLTFALADSPYRGTLFAVLDYLNTITDPDATLTEDDIESILVIAKETWEQNRGQPLDAGLTPTSESPTDGGREFVSGRNRYTINAPVPVREMGAYDELPLEGGSIFVQALPVNEAVGIGETLDCAAYGSDYFARNNLRAEEPFALRGLNGIPMCTYLIEGEGFYQYEMAFWNHGLPMGMSIFSRNLESFVRLFAFLLFSSNFGLVEPPPFTGCTATALQNANLRQGPGTGFGRAGTAAAGDAFDAVQRNRTADWVAVMHEGQTVWLAGFLVETDCAVDTLPVVED